MNFFQTVARSKSIDLAKGKAERSGLETRYVQSLRRIYSDVYGR